MKIELLAPAGSYEMMKAAFAAGADAVYIGGAKFGARAYAKNLSTKEMLEAIAYAHLRGKKLYLTVNTLLKDKEIKEELCQYLSPFYERGLDAVIVQDLGVLKVIKENFPDLPIHASTQMTITGTASVKLLKEAGASRVILPRELSLEEISDIKKDAQIELEGFVHGALCYSYSGQCLFSSYLGGRSGNRGRCAGPCRLPYSINENGKQLNKHDEQYLLSPKDICAISLLPEIIAAGVTSLKIEGRMKRPEYTAGVVRIYRKYLDLLADKKASFKVDNNDYPELMELYNRDGFSEGYYKCQNGRSMMAMKNDKITANGKAVVNQKDEALIARLQAEYIKKEERLPIIGQALLRLGQEASLTLSYGAKTITVAQGEVQAATKQPVSISRIKEQLNKSGNSQFYFSELEVCADDNIFIAIQSLNELRRTALARLEEEILKDFGRMAITTDEVAPDIKGRNGDRRESDEGLTSILTAQVETNEQLEVLYDVAGIAAIYANVGVFLTGDFASNVENYIKRMKAVGKKAYLSLPYVLRDNNDLTMFGYFNDFISKGLAGFLVHNIESYARLAELQLAERAVLDYQVYTLNDYSREFWRAKGILYDTVSPELNYHEIKSMDNRNSEMIIYGYAQMMVSAQCLKNNTKKCTKDFAGLELIDRYQKKFVVKNDCNFCYNIIYNSVALGLLKEYQMVKELGCRSLRLCFTFEGESESKAITRAFRDTYLNSKEPTLQQIFTKGHFKRGIE